MYTPSPQQLEWIERTFKYHPPVDGQPSRYQTIRREGGDLAGQLCLLCPPCPELDVALVKLQEAVMWANAAIARNET